MFALFFISCSPEPCLFSSPLKEAIEVRLGQTCESIDFETVEELNLSNWTEPIDSISTLQHFINLKDLRLSDSKIETIDFISHMPKLQVLHLDFTGVSDLEPLRDNTNLTQLWLNETKITSIEALEKHTSLRELSLRNTSILDISALESSSELLILDISGTQVQDISPLTKHKSLQIFSGRNTQIRSIDALQDHKDMLLLDLRKNRIRDISSLGNLSKLRALDIGENQLTTLPNLPTSLVEFHFDVNPIEQGGCDSLVDPWKEQCLVLSSISENEFLQKCLQIDTLTFATQTTLHTLQDIFSTKDCRLLVKNIQSKKIATTQPILDPHLIAKYVSEPIEMDWNWVAPCYNDNFTETCISSDNVLFEDQKSKFVEICTSKENDNLKTTIDALHSVTQRSKCSEVFDAIAKETSLNLTKMGISDLTPLQFFPHLRSLYLEYNKISDISALQYLSNLQILFIDDNQISDIRPLAPLKKMLWLSVGDNTIQDISVLENMVYLRRLWLGGNQITNIDALQHTSQLRKLHLASNQIKDISVLAQLEQLENIYLADNQITNILPLTQLSSLRTLISGLDEDESPLAVQQWFLKDNPISKCPQKTILPIDIFCLMYNK